MPNTLYSIKTKTRDALMNAYIAGLLSLFLTFSLQAQTISGIEIEETVLIADNTTPLVLNGAGIRSKFVFDIYIGSLYLTTKHTSADAIYTAPGAKRISMHFLYDEVGKEKLIDGWNDGFEGNLSKDELQKLKSRISQFNALFDTVKKGDVINLDFIPDKGTIVAINNKVKGTISGNDFFTAVLKIWLGDEPADSDLKTAMLGKKEE